MKIEVAFIEEWRRVAVVDVNEEALSDHFGHPPPFHTDELADYLQDTYADPDETWTGQLTPVNADRDEFFDLNVEFAEEKEG